jgi:hypothetical protein
MDLLEALVLNVAKSIRLVPSRGEHIKGDLASNGKCESIRPKLFLECLDKRPADMVFLGPRLDQARDLGALISQTYLVVFLKIEPLLNARK